MINGEYWGRCDLCGGTICCDSFKVAIVHGKAICEDCIDEIKNNTVTATKENRTALWGVLNRTNLKPTCN